MKEPFGGLILNVAFRMLVPFTITYGFTFSAWVSFLRAGRLPWQGSVAFL